MKYVLMQIGCIECGVSSYIVAASNSLDELREIKDKHPSKWDSEGGDGYTEIFCTETCQPVE